MMLPWWTICFLRNKCPCLSRKIPRGHSCKAEHVIGCHVTDYQLIKKASTCSTGLKFECCPNSWLTSSHSWLPRCKTNGNLWLNLVSKNHEKLEETMGSSSLIFLCSNMFSTRPYVAWRSKRPSVHFPSLWLEQQKSFLCGHPWKWGLWVSNPHLPMAGSKLVPRQIRCQPGITASQKYGPY